IKKNLKSVIKGIKKKNNMARLKFKKNINLDFEVDENIKYLLNKDNLDIEFKIIEIKQDKEIIIIEKAIIKSVSVIKDSHKDYNKK
ncbi:MAG: hypothetical protein KKH98_05605, partial [Spirochaetes bacterium]|nr:hypothetical protein [Spirochaetota bacterium]